jgi:hypothetical protein
MFIATKYSPTGSQQGCYRKGNWLVGDTIGLPYGGTETTGLWNAINPITNGYTLYLNKESNGPAIYTFNNGTELLNFCNTYLNANQQTVSEVLSWLDGQNNYLIDPPTPSLIFFGAFTDRTTSSSTVVVNYIANMDLSNNLNTTFKNNTGTAFNDQVINAYVYSDGRIICGGVFTTFNGVSANRIIRLNPDGTRDTSFNVGTGFDGQVSGVYVDEITGHIYVAGAFTTYKQVSVLRVARLLQDGTLDGTFIVNCDAQVRTIRFDNEYVYISGDFTTINNTSSLRIAKVRKSTGALVSPTGVGLNSGGWFIVIDPTDSNFIYVAGVGTFTSFNGVNCKQNLVKINVNTWQLDTTFNSNISNFTNRVGQISLDNNNRLIVVGNFTNYAGTGRNYIVKINLNGTLVTSFNPTNPSLPVRGGVYHPISNTISIHGSFTDYAGTTAARNAVIDGQTGSVLTAFDSIYSAGIGQDGWIGFETKKTISNP